MAEDEWGSTSQNADFSFDSSPYSPEDLEGGGEVVNKEGWYHFEVADVVRELDTLSNRGEAKSPGIRFDLLVLETVDGQSPAGSRLFHRVYMASKGGAPPAEGAVKSALSFAYGLGLVKAVEVDGRLMTVDAVTGKSQIGVAMWDRAKGKQIVAEVRFEKGTGTFKDKYSIPFGRCYSPTDDKVSHVKKNLDALAAIGVTGLPAAAPASKPATNGAPITPPPAATAAPANQYADISDL